MLAALERQPDLLVVDYAGIMRAERRLGELRHEVAGVYEDLRTIAGEFNMAVWTASQSNRGAWEKATPDMDDFAEGFSDCQVPKAEKRQIKNYTSRCDSL